VINVCPDGEGYWQNSFSGAGGKIKGTLKVNNTMWFGKYYSDVFKNKTQDNEDNGPASGLVMSQVGSRVLHTVQTNASGYWIESRTWNYIGVPEDCSSANMSSKLSGFVVFLCVFVHLVLPGLFSSSSEGGKKNTFLLGIIVVITLVVLFAAPSVEAKKYTYIPKGWSLSFFLHFFSTCSLTSSSFSF
jgi:hypothetical protein